MKTKFIFLIALVWITFSCNEDSDTDSRNNNPDIFFGTLSYSLDESSSKSVLSAQTEKTVSVTDKNGVKWTLTIPAQPLFFGDQISITPIENFNDVKLEFNPTSGVVFSPDGLVFDIPATLTVEFEKPPINPPVFFDILGDGIKDTIELMPAQKDGSVYKLNIFHFSGSITGNPDLDALYKNVSEQLAVANAEANEVLKQSMQTTIPPKVPFNYCSGTANRAQSSTVNNYVETLTNQERIVMRKLLALSKSLCLIASENCEPSTKILALSDRLVNKAIIALNEYAGDEDYFIPVVKAALNIAKENDLLGGGRGQEILSILQVKYLALRDKMLDKLKTGHDYRIIPLLFNLESACGIIGASDGSEFIETIKKAATFEAYILTEYTKSDGSLEVQTEITATLQMNDNNLNLLTDNTQVKFISGRLKPGDTHVKNCAPWINMRPYNLPIDVYLSIDACEKNDANLSFGPITQTFIMGTEISTGSYWVASPEPGQCVTRSDPSAFGYSAFMTQAGIPLIYDIMRNTILIEESNINYKTNIIDKTLPYVVGPFIIVYTIKLEHIPRE